MTSLGLAAESPYRGPPRLDGDLRGASVVLGAGLAGMTAVYWPGVHGPAPDIGAVQGTAPRRPPLSWAARGALLAIGRNVCQVDDQLGSLSEPGLRGLESEVERHATVGNAALWRRVAGHARHRGAILAARRTGRGEWYAVVTAMRRENDRRDRVVATAHVKAKGREAAVAAGRLLLAEKADCSGRRRTCSW